MVGDCCCGYDGCDCGRDGLCGDCHECFCMDSDCPECGPELRFVADLIAQEESDG